MFITNSTQQTQIHFNLTYCSTLNKTIKNSGMKRGWRLYNQTNYVLLCDQINFYYELYSCAERGWRSGPGNRAATWFDDSMMLIELDKNKIKMIRWRWDDGVIKISHEQKKTRTTIQTETEKQITTPKCTHKL